MISLRFSASVFVEGATSEEEARAAVIEHAGTTEISHVTRTGLDESPVYTVKLKDQVVTLEEGAPEETEPSPEEFKEVTE